MPLQPTGKSRPGAKPTPAEQERRQITILFCDIVDSTLLVSRLDPEDLREVLNDFQATVRAEMQKLEGHLLMTLGDGAMAIFGFPLAHEDDPERAVRGGLATIQQLRRLNEHHRQSLRLRIGIATGLALVTRLPDGNVDVFGTAVNLAARIQAEAPADSVVVCAETHALLQGAFAFTDLGRRAMKGFPEPQQVWRVDQPLPRGQRQPATAGRRVPPFVGRAEVLAALGTAWAAASRGRGALLSLLGEPGLGKTRLVRSLAEGLDPAASQVMTFHASPLFAGSPLHPVTEYLLDAAGVGLEAGPQQRFEALLALFTRDRVLPDEQAQRAARWLANAEEAAPSAATGDVLRQVVADLAALLVGWARRRPALVIFEDIHCADPTTLDLLHALAAAAAGAPLLLVATARPEGQPLLAAISRSLFTLDRLAPADARLLLDSLVSDLDLDEAVKQEIVQRSDGVPLFLEELASTVLRQGVVAVPRTLEGSLLARLGDNLRHRAVAHIGALLGRGFEPQLVAAIGELEPAAVQEAIGEMRARGLILASGASETAHAFRHALVEQAIYGSIPHRRRRELHRRAAEALQRLRPESARRFPEIVAEHLTRAEAFEAAAEQWLLAGRRAVERSALREGERHLKRGLEALSEVGEQARRESLELDLQLELGPVLIATKGPGSSEVERLYERARWLAPRRFEVLWGQWRTETDNERHVWLAEELGEAAAAAGDPDLLLQAHHAAWASHFNHGEIGRCLQHISEGMALYDAERHLPQAARFGGHDAACCAFGVAGLAHWALGDVAAADDSLRRGLQLSGELGHDISHAHLLDFALTLRQHQGRIDELRALSGELEHLAVERGLPHYLARARIFRGWADAVAGGKVEGVQEMRRAIADLRRTGEEDDFTVFLTLLAEGQAAAGDAPGALATLGELGEITDQPIGVRYWGPEILRRRALLQLDLGEHAEALRLARRALALAQHNRHPMLALRAAIVLASILAPGGGREEALSLLRDAMAALPADQMPPELAEAQQLVETLAAGVA